MTIGWRVWDLSGSPFLVGTVGGFRAFPFLLIGPWAGVLADRVDRRKLVLISQTGLATAAFLFALLVASGQVQEWHAFAYIAIAGVAHSDLQPVRSALVANTVPKEDLTNAFDLDAMTITSTRLVWPALGGVLIGVFGFTVNFFIESALYMTPPLFRATLPSSLTVNIPLFLKCGASRPGIDHKLTGRTMGLYWAVSPPSITSSLPVTKEASSEAR